MADALTSAATGASSGMALGPWGAIGGAALGLAGSIWGNYKAGKAQKEYENYLNNAIAGQKDTLKGRFTDLEGTFNRRNSQDYLNTEAAQAMQRRFNEYAKNARESIQGQAIAAGATPEAQVAQQKSISDSYNQMLDSLAQQSTAYKLQNQSAYDAQKMGLMQQQDALANSEINMKAGLLKNKIDSANQMGSNIANAGSGIVNAWAEGAFSGWKKQ